MAVFPSFRFHSHTTQLHPAALTIAGVVPPHTADTTEGTTSNTPEPQRTRSSIPERYRWNLNDLYSSDDEWRNEKEKLKQEIPSIEGYRGTLGSAAGQLLDCLELVSRLSKEFSRLYSYASMRSDEDTRDTKYLGMQQEMSQIGSSLASAASFIEPEILRIDGETVDAFLREEQRLEVYRHSLDDIRRRKNHTGSEGEERIIATASLMADAPQTIYEVFSDADFPFPDVALSDGTSVRLPKAAFALHRASPNRDDRKKVFSAFFGRLGEYRRTFGAELNAELRKNLFYMKSRNYGSCLEAALHASNIPAEVYRTLIRNVNDNLASFHRYLNLRKRILGVEELHYYDLYAPLLKEVDLRYTFDDAQAHLLDSLAPLGEEYVTVSRTAFTQRWIDVFPTDGKRSGAYSNGSAYDVHPYILLNFNGKYDDMATLAHELGHTLHSYFSNKRQPYPTAQYAIFVAEVASTFNEALLIHHMLKTVDDDRVKLSLLGNYLEGIKGTIFRQTQFAEFELTLHEMAERGEALTGDVLCDLYEQMTRRYYGHDAGICIVDEEIRSEWAYIPHFYYNFYVYQYATSFTASAALSERVLAGDRETTQKYLEFLSSGGSDYPINLLRNAGIDMTSPEPFALTMQKMNRVMDEMEEILSRMTASD